MIIRVNNKENLLFTIKVICTLFILFGIINIFQIFSQENDAAAALAGFLLYILFIGFFFFFQKILLVGYLKGNGVEINTEQFPEIYQMYITMIESLNIRKIPPLFIIQQGGALNAFAVRLSGKNYIAIYSDIFEMILTDSEAVKFIRGHELGHIKRNHISKRFWTMLSAVIPFLEQAYSRSCEFTCDTIGHDLAPGGSLSGLLVLASGKKLYKEINAEKYLENAKKQKTFVVWFTELFSSHPYLPNRIRSINKLKQY